MLCATEPDAASKHRDRRMEPHFGSLSFAAQHTKRRDVPPLKLNHRYFFITHCPPSCCR